MCWECTSDCSLLCYQFILPFVGGALSISGICTHQALNDYEEISKTFGLLGIGMIVLGLILIIISCYGCCASTNDNYCMTVTYVVFLLIILIIQVTISVWAFETYKDINSDKWTDTIKKKYGDIFETYWSSENDRTIVNVAQNQLKCCGLNSYTDYTNSTYFTNTTIPWSCCGHAEGDNCLSSSTFLYTTGCLQALKQTFAQYAKFIGGFTVFIAVTVLYGMMIAACRARTIRNEGQGGYMMIEDDGSGTINVHFGEGHDRSRPTSSYSFPRPEGSTENKPLLHDVLRTALLQDAEFTT